MPVDIRRRAFLFGVSATLVLPPKRTIFIPVAKRIITLEELWNERPLKRGPEYDAWKIQMSSAYGKFGSVIGAA